MSASDLPAAGGAAFARPLDLPCGARLANRLAKSAMSDSLGNGAGDPTHAQVRMYQRWAAGGLGLSIIGEVQSDPFALEKPGNLVLAPDGDAERFRALTAAGTAEGGHFWAQLGHAGALAYPEAGQPRGPSALDYPELRCAGMTAEEVAELPALLAKGAARAKQLGFTGVQVHAAHGFLLSQFLSPLFNRRDDAYGGTLDQRARIVVEVVRAVREAVGPRFPVSIKVNVSDQLEGGLSEPESDGLFDILDKTSLDLIEISAGTYFPGAASEGGSGGGPQFLDAARRARRRTDKPLMAAGGFKTRAQALAALEDGDLDVVALARALVLEPALPRIWAEGGGDPTFPRFHPRPPEGGVTAWYTLRITALAEDREDTFELDPVTALRQYDARDAARAASWTARFGRPAGV